VCPEGIDECPDKNRIPVAFSVEKTSGMDGGDLADLTAFVLAD
jgi:hypothetical protein